MSEHNLDKMFREKLGGHQAAYNPASWAAAESMIDGKSSKGGFWLLGLLGIAMCTAALFGMYIFQASTEDSYAISAQNDVLLSSRIQEMNGTANTQQNSNSTLAMLKPSTNNNSTDIQVNNASGEKQLDQNSSSKKSQLESQNDSSASANAILLEEKSKTKKEKADVILTSSETSNAGSVSDKSDGEAITVVTTPAASTPLLLANESTNPPKPQPSAASDNDNNVPAATKNQVSGSTKNTSPNFSEDYVEPKTEEQPSLASESEFEQGNNNAQKTGLLSMLSLPPALAIYDIQAATFNASILPVDQYHASFWELKFHAGYGYNTRSLKPLQEGVEGYTALRDSEESIGWSPEIGFEAIYEPGRLNYSIGLNWYSIGETNNYTPTTDYETTLDTSLIYTSIETSYYGVDSIWVQEKDSGGFFGYWDVFVTQELSEEALVLEALDSTTISTQTPVDPTNERTTFQYVEIPLSIGYEFQQGSWSLGLRTGISAGLLISTTGQYLDTDRQSAIVKQDISRRWIWNYQARIAVGYAINDKTRIYLEPVFKTNINSIVNRTDFSQKYSTYALRLGLGFKF